jgi:hypothetical protein
VSAWRAHDLAGLHELIDEVSAEPDEGRSFALLMLDEVAQLGLTVEQLEEAITTALVELGFDEHANGTVGGAT